MPDLAANEKAAPEPLSSQGLRASFTPEQDKAYDEFLAQVKKDGLLEDPLGLEDHECRDGIHDEATLFRFFTARGCDAAKAHALFKEAIQARKANEMAEFYKNLDIELHQETRLLYPYWIGRRDKRGIPIYIIDISLLNAKTVAAHKKTSNTMSDPQKTPDSPAMAPGHVRRSYAMHDHLTRFVMPLCSAAKDRPNPEIPITKQFLIADLNGLGISSAWKLRDWAQDMGQLLAGNYPEVLDQAFIVGAPSYFGVIWSWVKLLLDPSTASKVRVLAPNEILPTLEEFIDIENIPEKYGGKLPTTAGMMPTLDKEIIDLLGWAPESEKSLPAGPLHWIKGANGSKTAVAVGMVKGEKRCSEFATLQ
ncbi:Phosphatidylinositol/phosphatidylcholine transfer protein SFH1 [Lachnellula suecica]|uniref:Phosphatidylinositol/phosphatidylcholine transfer protein SFH1 n=1 Tax=Lachnellula suecica TaxID=602035 RepID=A0A8T9CC07_9HELO|nr:Phosphatidylinositol/phosphatidylcholine transfer protein SFH1 [Lachnellula suecica]